jgi:hypothetical protein
MSVNISTVHLDTLGIIHECRLIAETINRQCPAHEMKNPHKKRGQWYSLFYLRLSDISAATCSF